MTIKLRYLYRAYRYRYRVDRAELRFLRDHLRPGQVAVDVGCHKGAYTYWMRWRVGPDGAVFAFEPQPRQVAYLQTAFATLPFQNVVLVPMALSDTPGQATLHVPSGTGRTHAASLEPGRVTAPNGSCHSNRVTLDPPCSAHRVAVTTLDAFFADQPRGPNFLKIDVEGHESAVLRGGRRTLETHRPTLLLECEARHRPDGDVRAVFDLLTSLGYMGKFIHDGHLRPLSEFDPAVHQRVEPASARLPQGYVNNFTFEPAEK